MKLEFKNAKGLVALEMSGAEANLDIFGEIGSWWDGIDQASFIKALDATKGASLINVRIHSNGGDLFDGVFMYNLLKSHPAEKRAMVLGLCASAATLPYMACKTRLMGNGTSLMIHRALAGMYGYAEDFRRVADSLDEISAEAARLYSVETAMDLEAIKTMMAAETWMTPEKAIENGFATGMLEDTTEAPQLQSSTLLSNYKNMPEEAKRFFSTGTIGDDPVIPPPEEPADAPDNFAAIAQMRLVIREREMKRRL